MSGGQTGQFGQQQQLPPSGYGRRHLGPWGTPNPPPVFGINPPPEGLNPPSPPGERIGGPGVPPPPGAVPPPMPVVTQPPVGATPPPFTIMPPVEPPGERPGGPWQPPPFGIQPPPEGLNPPPAPPPGRSMGLGAQQGNYGQFGNPNAMPLGAPMPDYYNGPQADPTMEMLRRRNGMGGGLLAGGQPGADLGGAQWSIVGRNKG